MTGLSAFLEVVVPKVLRLPIVRDDLPENLDGLTRIFAKTTSQKVDQDAGFESGSKASVTREIVGV